MFLNNFMKNNKKQKNNNQIIIYNTEDGQAKLDVTLDGETVWLTLEQMGQFFDKAKSTINELVVG